MMTSAVLLCRSSGIYTEQAEGYRVERWEAVERQP